MITVSNVSLIFSDKKLFEDVNLKFLPGNCYGVIGANGAGKSTFLKLLSGEKEPSSGDIIIEKNKRLAVLSQNQNAFDDFTVLETVIMGHKELFDIMKAKEIIYNKETITDEEGYELSHLEAEFAELNGWDAESDAERLLNGLNVPESEFYKMMSDILPKHKVKVLLAQALFGNPDILLLDEPTNNLDFEAIGWLENFLVDYQNTVITVSHDRHFLNNVCTHMVDIDYNQARMYVGNYDFWMESSQLVQRLMADKNKKKEERIQELKAFIARFSANLSKSSQATSRKKALEKIELDEIIPSTRKYPFIGFEIEKQLGKDVLEVENLSVSLDGKKLFQNVSFVMNRGDKVALLGDNDLAKTALLKILAGELTPETGTIKWGQTVTKSYFPADNDDYFLGKQMNLIEWLRPYSKEPAESYLRGFLGRMLFSGDQPLKEVRFLSGGEKMRCMYSKLMLSQANTLLIDSPTIHLDLEAIQAVNRGLEDYKGALVVASHDHSLLQSVCNKVIEVADLGSYSYEGTFDEYISNKDIKQRTAQLYKENK
ncbi:MAG: ABC transporter ATP-binding protein [Tenericutes bacterium GWC2_34_14]|nr:MAG: ABC transporter ATP-binding protein [Tenericutes bacterium GWA2_35_7]OHE28817.1 MAG: ABC transporter ATP-binding protein [Tenericutes bacterium GWC2_34_14]OHE33285.1 MAG: ABC transporter ATP-binding protein [Tenericutes bacterium GWE2_34_108]OHE36435.1 MAG: ABC transporter ATP-binding protein [Tenericutes bacterium GWF1_35_14]OHE37639.1 MAG: ABC transporter ATP-binding protein [Tenericutes bacterium GWF2_35_184]OHE45084.1 MAG: ABC transporter ATP-binding protein [Tenericutes bacterium 